MFLPRLHAGLVAGAMSLVMQLSFAVSAAIERHPVLHM